MALKLLILELTLVISSYQFYNFHCDVEGILLHLQSQLKVKGINLVIRNNVEEGEAKRISDLFKSTLVNHQSVCSTNEMIINETINSTEAYTIFFVSANANVTELEQVVEIYRKTAMKSSPPKIFYTIISSTNHTDFIKTFNYFFKKLIVDVIVLKISMHKRSCTFQVHYYDPLSKMYSKCNWPESSIVLNKKVKDLHGQRFYMKETSEYFKKILDHVRNVSTNFNTYEARFVTVDVLSFMNATMIRTKTLKKCVRSR